MEGQVSRFIDPDTGMNTKLLQSLGVLADKAGDAYGGEYAMSLVDAQGMRQPLILHYADGEYQRAPDELLWSGDLDGDGRRDYLFDVNGEVGATMLYLSTQAKPGEVAGLVALMWHWYCC
jgi:hypothetical protein